MTFILKGTISCSKLMVATGDRHSDPRLVKESEMSPMQKRNKRVDKCKDEWALLHGIPLIRIWEKDIRENPDKVMQMLKERLSLQDSKLTKEKEMNKRHVNKMRML